MGLTLTRRVLAAQTGALALGAVPAFAADAKPIKIGFGEAMTGPLAAIGKSGILAMQIWRDQINAKGGLLGRPVELVFYDNQSNPANVPALYTKLPYDPFKDLAAVVLTTSQPNLLAVNAGLPVKSVRELIDYVRRNPGKLNYGSIGSGSSSHLTMELMKMQAGLFIVHIPYNGSPPAAASLAAADTQVLFTVPTALTPLIQAGKVRALAVSGLKRYSLMPEVPTVAESGLAKFEAIAWNGVLVPAGTPRPIIDRLNREMNLALESADVRQKLNAEINKALNTTTVQEKFAANGYTAYGGTPEAFSEFIRKEIDKWAKVIKNAGIAPQ